MATERSTEESWKNHPDQKDYDLAYYNIILPMVSGVVIDVGCGVGMLASKMAEKEQVEVVHAIDRFKDRVYHDKVVHYYADLEKNFPAPYDLEADFIVSTEFIEHINRESLDPLLKSINKHMHEKSIFVGTTPNNTWGKTTNQFHIYEYSLEELRTIFGKFFADVDVRDVGKNCAFWICKSPRLL